MWYYLLNSNNIHSSFSKFYDVISAVSVMLNSLLVYVRMVEAAKVTHKNLLDNIIKQPMSFFDTTPTGRILNRFTKDVDVVDGHLPRVLRMWLEFIFYLISILVVISYSTPMFLGVAVPVIICFIFIQVGDYMIICSSSI